MTDLSRWSITIWLFVVLIALLFWNGPGVGQTAQTEARGQVLLKASVAQTQSGTIHCRWEATNRGNSDVFIADNGRSANGVLGPSISLENGQQLILGYRLFKLPATLLLTKNESGVHVRLLKSGETYRAELELRLPTPPTVPPYEHFQSNQQIDAARVRVVEMTIGSFAATADLVAAVEHRSSGWVNGLESLSHSPGEERLISRQVVIASNPLPDHSIK